MGNDINFRLNRDVMVKAWGEPTKETKDKLTWNGGDDYSYRAYNVAKGVWYDSDTKRGGNTMLDLGYFVREGRPLAKDQKLRGEEFTGLWQWLAQEKWIEVGPPPKFQDREPSEIYNYEDASGALSFQVCRFEPPLPGDEERGKSFRQRHLNGDGEWVWNVTGVTPVPYRLPQLLESTALVLILEGEKDCNRAAKLGLIATTNAMGAGKWKPELSQYFRDRDVVIVPDRDPQSINKKTGEPLWHPDGRPVLPGQDHAQSVAAALKGIAAKVRIVELWQWWPDMPLKGDISDWFDAGGTVEELAEIVQQTPEWKAPGAPQREPGGRYTDFGADELPTSPPPQPLPFVNMSNWDNEPVPQQEWTVFNRPMTLDEKGQKKLHRLLRLHGTQSQILMSLAVKLRLTPSSRATPDRARDERKTTSMNGAKPWNDWQ
jgi:hypothetical protein